MTDKGELSEWFDNLLLPSEAWVVDIIFRDTTNPLPADVDQNELLNFITRNGLAPLVFFRLKKHQKQYPESFLSALKKEYLSSLLRNANLYNTGDEISVLLRKQGIPVIHLKGGLIGPTIYGDAALRPMSDIDLLVPADEISNAVDQIIKKGGKVVSSHEKDIPTNHHYPLITYKTAPIELHRYLFPIHSKYFIPIEDIWHQATEWRKEPPSILGPSRVHTLLYLMVHVYYTFKRGGLRLGWLADFIWLYKHLTEQDLTEASLWVKKWQINEPYTFITTLIKLLSRGKITFPSLETGHSNEFYRPQLKRAVRFFRHSSQQNEAYSYELMWERIKEAKSFKEKISLLKQSLTKGVESGSPKAYSSRFYHLFIKTLKMLQQKAHDSFYQ